MKYRNTYYRIVNDVVQSISFVKDDYQCDIRIDVIPLCLGLDFKKCGFLYHQIEIGILAFDYAKRWEYMNKNDKDDVNRVLNEVCSVCNDYLPNLFSRIINCNKYYEFITSYEEKYLRCILHYPDLLYASLKGGLYEKAMNHINIMIKENEKILRSMKRDKKYTIEDIQGSIKESEEWRSLLEGIKHSIMNQDYEYITKLLVANEEISKNSLLALVKTK